MPVYGSPSYALSFDTSHTRSKPLSGNQLWGKASFRAFIGLGIWWNKIAKTNNNSHNNAPIALDLSANTQENATLDVYCGFSDCWLVLTKVSPALSGGYSNAFFVRHPCIIRAVISHIRSIIHPYWSILALCGPKPSNGWKNIATQEARCVDPKKQRRFYERHLKFHWNSHKDNSTRTEETWDVWWHWRGVQSARP